MSDERSKADEAQLILLREAASLASVAVMLLLLHPGVNLWLRRQVLRVQQYGKRDQYAEDRAISELRRDISAYEHGEVQL